MCIFCEIFYQYCLTTEAQQARSITSCIQIVPFLSKRTERFIILQIVAASPLKKNFIGEKRDLLLLITSLSIFVLVSLSDRYVQSSEDSLKANFGSMDYKMSGLEFLRAKDMKIICMSSYFQGSVTIYISQNYVLKKSGICTKK